MCTISKRTSKPAVCLPPPQNEKVVLFINTAELSNELFLVCVYEFVKDNGISVFFSDESQSKIISGIRSDLTLAGLHFDKDTAWSFFLGYVYARHTSHCTVLYSCITLQIMESDKVLTPKY